MPSITHDHLFIISQALRYRDVENVTVIKVEEAPPGSRAFTKDKTLYITVDGGSFHSSTPTTATPATPGTPSYVGYLYSYWKPFVTGAVSNVIQKFSYYTDHLYPVRCDNDFINACMDRAGSDISEVIFYGEGTRSALNNILSWYQWSHATMKKKSHLVCLDPGSYAKELWSAMIECKGDHGTFDEIGKSITNIYLTPKAMNKASVCGTKQTVYSSMPPKVPSSGHALTSVEAFLYAKMLVDHTPDSKKISLTPEYVKWISYVTSLLKVMYTVDEEVGGKGKLSVPSKPLPVLYGEDQLPTSRDIGREMNEDILSFHGRCLFKMDNGSHTKSSILLLLTGMMVLNDRYTFS